MPFPRSGIQDGPNIAPSCAIALGWHQIAGAGGAGLRPLLRARVLGTTESGLTFELIA